MSDQTFFVVGYPKSRDLQHVHAIGAFPDRATADEYTRNVLKGIQFKFEYIWATVWLDDPDIYRSRSDDVVG